MRKGQFQPGNPGGPGRPAKASRMIVLQIADTSAPLKPDRDCSREEWLKYDLESTFYEAMGFWHREIQVTPKQFATLMDVFKAMKLADKDATLSEAYAKLHTDFVAEAFADLEASVKRGQKALRRKCQASE